MPQHVFGKHEAQAPDELVQLIKQWLQVMGNDIKNACPDGMGFALLLFEYGSNQKPGNMYYTSSAQRDDVIKAMSEFIEKNSERS